MLVISAKGKYFFLTSENQRFMTYHYSNGPRFERFFAKALQNKEKEKKFSSSFI